MPEATSSDRSSRASSLRHRSCGNSDASGRPVRKSKRRSSKWCDQGNGIPDGPRLQRAFAPRRLGLWSLPPNGLAHEGAGAHPRRHEALRTQPVIGHGYGRARDAKPQRQLSAGWQGIGGPEPPVQDGPLELAVDLPAQILATDQADVELHAVNLARGFLELAWSN